MPHVLRHARSHPLWRSLPAAVLEKVAAAIDIGAVRVQQIEDLSGSMEKDRSRTATIAP
jgi:hypothetical protein